MATAAKFPRLHIADSVVNRILNLNDSLVLEKEIQQSFKLPEMPPQIAEPILEGGAINAALAKPAEPVAMGAATDPLAMNVAGGKDLLESV
jgi:hypothetical protein